MGKSLAANQLTDEICVVVGTRPGIIMFSPIIRELQRRDVPFFILHTGQHYSYSMDRIFFEELRLPEPRHFCEGMDIHTLHGGQTAAMVVYCEQMLLQEKPRIVLVGGDANTNLAGALAATKLGIPVGHVEAGERSHDWRMPEEQNRVLIDHIADLLFATNNNSVVNLQRDDVRGHIILTGNPIVDATIQNLNFTAARNGLYILATLHRQENISRREILTGVFAGLYAVSRESGLPLIFPMHPHTRRKVSEFGVPCPIGTTEPAGYLEFLGLLSGARMVLTDSGGVQQEACILRVPCVTLRDTTEWVGTLSCGANILAGHDPDMILKCALAMMDAGADGWTHDFGDGHSAERIVEAIT